MWTEYFSGVPLRTLARNRTLALGTIFNHIKKELELLPRNEDITKAYCSRWGGVLNVDGVYVKVKGYEKALPFIFGIDFETHDIPGGFLATAENEEGYVRFFELVREAGYPLRLVVCDENPAIKAALARVFPGVEVQLCQVHVLRNIKALLHVSRTDTTHIRFFQRIWILFRIAGKENRGRYFQNICRMYDANSLYWEVIRGIMGRWDDLFRFEAYRKLGLRVPQTNNLIEGYNNHFKARVKSIKGFESFSTAALFVNAWIVRRRFTPFHECGKPFEHLNGYSSFQKSRNPSLPWPEIFGISTAGDTKYQPENER